MNLVTLFRRIRTQDSSVDVEAAIRKITQDAEQLGHADGRRNWPPADALLPAQAEESFRARSRRLMHTTTAVFTSELSAASAAVKLALIEYRRAGSQLPEALRQAQQVLSNHLAAFEVPLHEAARHAEATARRRRADEIEAGRVFDAEHGKLTLMRAGLLLATVIESGLGASLMHNAHPDGWVGSAGLASTIAALNLAASFSVGRLVRTLVDRQTPGWRVGAGAVLVSGLGLLVLFHSVVAKVRELSLAQSFETAMQHAVGLVLSSPPTEFSSILVGLLGLGCGITSMVLGYQHADVNQAEREAALVNDAEATLQAFQRARADYHSLDPVRAAASRILSEQETKVAGAHKKLAEAIHKFDTLWLQLADLHGQIQCAQVEAELVYRTRNLAVRTEPPPKAWLEQGETVKTVPAAAVAGLDHTGVEAARAALAATAYDQEHAQALAALNAHAEAIANRVADGLAQYQDAVFHDCQSPATMSLSRSGSPKLAPVADLRRNPLEGSAGA